MTVSHYRFYFKNGDHTLAAEVAECDDDGAAVAQAKERLARSTFGTMEVWQGDRKVGVVKKEAN